MKSGILLPWRVIAAAALAVLVHSAHAVVSAEEAAQLGTTLTEFGAEKAGNADGSIPAYTGGIDKATGYDPATATRYVDPFKDDKPLYSVTAENMAQHDALLAPGSKILLKSFPGFRIDVYPTRRSMRYSAAVLQNTVKNATTARLAGKVAGDAIEGVDVGNLPHAGIPFPIPKSGYEVMWNNTLHFSAAVNQFTGTPTFVDSSGNVDESTTAIVWWVHPWYDVKGTLRAKTFDSVFGFSSSVLSPAKLSGAGYLGFYLADTSEGQKSWFYIPGQRRIRPAPDFSYDMPMNGSILWDEIAGFHGRMDRFDFKLTGKTEMLVPYNIFGVTNTIQSKDYLGKKFVNPDAVRWERHRVWVVDAVRKPDAKHMFSRRTLYVDEDCWCVTQVDAYNDAGEIARVTHVNNFPSYATGGINVNSWTFYDLVKGGYYVFNGGYANEDRYARDYETAEGLPIPLTAQAIVGRSIQ